MCASVCVCMCASMCVYVCMHVCQFVHVYVCASILYVTHTQYSILRYVFVCIHDTLCSVHKPLISIEYVHVDNVHLEGHSLAYILSKQHAHR